MHCHATFLFGCLKQPNLFVNSLSGGYQLLATAQDAGVDGSLYNGGFSPIFVSVFTLSLKKNNHQGCNLAWKRFGMAETLGQNLV
jgi:hypothetical protein